MRSVVFLRGMNLGNRRITNDDLSAAFGRLGHDGATPYQASGNVVLPDGPVPTEADLSAGLESQLGYGVEVFVRSSAELEILLRGCPFAGASGTGGGKPQVIFVRQVTPAELADVFETEDRWEAADRAIHWLPSTGLAERGSTVRRLDAVVGPNTTRTLGTVQRIVQKLG